MEAILADLGGLNLNFVRTWRILSIQRKSTHTSSFQEALPSQPHHSPYHALHHKLWMKLIVSARSTRSITLFVPVRSSARVHLALHWSLPTRALHVDSLSFIVSFRPKSERVRTCIVFPEDCLPYLKHGTRTA